jgi:hypothetical protein
MKQENARALLEIRLQKLLWEYIRCLEQYCHILYKINAQQTSPDSLEQLDRFIIILKTLRKLLQDITKKVR